MRKYNKTLSYKKSEKGQIKKYNKREGTEEDIDLRYEKTWLINDAHIPSVPFCAEHILLWGPHEKMPQPTQKGHQFPQSYLAHPHIWSPEQSNID
jgi:hypothetical protein